MRDKRTQTYYINDAWTRTRPVVGIKSLQVAKEELQRLKHLPMYREVCTFERPDVPWASDALKL